jgi:cytoskeletal protein RodZ
MPVKGRGETVSETLGEILERRRRSLGRSLADAEADTRIRARLLEALEKGDYEALPSPAYVRGYVISYAKFLGLESAPLVELYDKETGRAASVESVRLPEQVVAPRGQGQHLPARTALIVLAVLIVAVGAIWGVSRALQGPEAPPPIPTVPEPTSTVDPSEEPTAPGETDPAETPEEEEAALPEPFTLTVVIASDSASWLRVTVDGLTAYEGTMAGGQTEEWEVAEEASLRIGRPTAVTVYRDDTEVEIPEGDPPTLVLSATD